LVFVFLMGLSAAVLTFIRAKIRDHVNKELSDESDVCKVAAANQSSYGVTARLPRVYLVIQSYSLCILSS
jgi:hypothetical protein